MIGNILKDEYDKINSRKNAAETGNVVKLTRDYIDSLMIELRTIDSVEASTKMNLFGETFSTPVMVAALSGLGKNMLEAAKGAAAANTIMWAGIGDDSELKALIETGVKVIKIIKPYKDKNLIFEKISQAEQNGAFAVGMDIDFVFGGEIGESLVRTELMGPKTLDDIKSFVHATKLPFILKGVLSEKDAKKALESGAAAIVISHHGGTVLDYAVPPLKILPRIAKVINKKIPIFVDSGIIRGTDVFKALALGANGVLIGRTVVAALSSLGGEGVQKIISGTNEELRRAMSLTGSSDIENIDPEIIWY